MLTHGSLFAGVEGFGEGFRRAGFNTLWQVEREPFCIAVLKTRFPNVERYYDVLKCGHDRIHKLRAVDVLTAGFPCQDVSVAGKRAGLAGARSGLFWEVVRILGELRTTWFVLENVPGLFSSNDGRDFAVILESLDELGYGLAWRVLDSQYFGVAQRRRRVFIVGCLGKPCPAEVLFESEGGGGDIEAGGEERAGVTEETCDRIASPIRHNDGGCESGGPRGGYGENLVAAQISSYNQAEQSYRGDGSDNIVATLNSGGNDGGFRTEPGEHLVASCVSGIADGMPGISRGRHTSEQRSGARSGWNENQGRDVGAPPDSNRVRDFAGLPLGLDSARYRALGNAATVSVAEWIGRRIIEAESLKA